jgi:hypothetical protein
MLQCKKWTNWQMMPPATTQLSWFWKKSFRVKVSLEREREPTNLSSFRADWLQQKLFEQDAEPDSVEELFPEES